MKLFKIIFKVVKLNLVIFFSLFVSYSFCQTVIDSTFIKNEAAKQYVLQKLTFHSYLYSKNNEFDFKNCFKKTENIFTPKRISYNETEVEKINRKWQQYINYQNDGSPSMRYLDPNYKLAKYFFDAN